MKRACDDSRARVYSYLDGEIGRYRRWKIRRHLRRCPPCTDGFSFERKLQMKIRDDCVDDVPEELYDRLSAFLRENGPTDESADPTAGGLDV